MVAIYGQFNKSIPLESATHSSYAAYEVIVIRTLPAATIMGKDTPERESCPGNEQWGTSGWTYKTLNEAKIKMQDLLKQKPSSGGVGKGDGLGVSKRN